MRAAILAIALAACRYEGEFPCTQNAQCRAGSAELTCEQAGWCSVTDDECESGRRFDDTAGDGLAGTCVPGPDNCTTWTPHFFSACKLPPPSGNLSISGMFVFDTTTGTLTEQITATAVPQPSIVVDGIRYLSVQDVTIVANATLRVIGDKPLVIAAWGSMNIGGLIDAGSHNGAGGAGFNPAGCTAGEGSDATTMAAGGGGGGGAFQGNGGKGGGGAAGGAGSLVPPQTLRGGCSGGRSGKAGLGAMDPATSDTSATGGRGGGALALSSRLSITIDGAVGVGGEGGNGSPAGAGCGGAGGGAGGMLVLDAPTVALHGTANAAGGGGGGVAAKTGQGMKGRDATVSGAAGGTPGTNCTGTGGAGSTVAMPNGTDGGTGTCGGAGGGGGSGWIIVFADIFDTVGAFMSPTPSEKPF
jgi:hypothetical protein